MSQLDIETIEQRTYRLLQIANKNDEGQAIDSDFGGEMFNSLLENTIFKLHCKMIELAIAEEREACNKSGVNIDECIDLSAALERQRALKIIEAVMSARIGGAESTMPTPFQAGYQLACDESIFRIKNEEWELRLPKHHGRVFPKAEKK